MTDTRVGTRQLLERWQDRMRPANAYRLMRDERFVSLTDPIKEPGTRGRKFLLEGVREFERRFMNDVGEEDIARSQLAIGQVADLLASGKLTASAAADCYFASIQSALTYVGASEGQRAVFWDALETGNAKRLEDIVGEAKTMLRRLRVIYGHARAVKAGIVEAAGRAQERLVAVRTATQDLVRKLTAALDGEPPRVRQIVLKAMAAGSVEAAFDQLERLPGDAQVKIIPIFDRHLAELGLDRGSGAGGQGRAADD